MRQAQFADAALVDFERAWRALFDKVEQLERVEQAAQPVALKGEACAALLDVVHLWGAGVGADFDTLADAAARDRLRGCVFELLDALIPVPGRHAANVAGPAPRLPVPETSPK